VGLTEHDRHFLERALSLAEKGRGLTSPNPLVGAVVVVEGRIAGEGFHAGPGEDHAEVVAMKRAVGDDFPGHLRGATIFVTLEPCSHHGRTPPCADALIAAGFSRVVVGSTDPSRKVNGQGLARLREAGIEVELAEGDLGYRCRRQNDPFRKSSLSGLPFVTYKYAMTLDGRVATQEGDARWISGEESRACVHRHRAWSDVVLVGSGTLRTDDPVLTARGIQNLRRQPLRAVVDSSLGISHEAKLVQTVPEGPVLAVCSEQVTDARVEEVRSWGVEVERVQSDAAGRCLPGQVVRVLGDRGVQSVLLEGGPRLAASWWDAGLVDRVLAFVAPIVAGGASAPGPLPSAGYPHMDAALRLRDVEIGSSGGDVMISGYLREPA
jgi:diaminohydroxyphosphoribosylaminopyrimidine deaminase / 5-amino-6-(5-phosphoribosylamino)uracil reductase